MLIILQFIHGSKWKPGIEFVSRATAFFDHAVVNVIAHQIIIETNCEYLALSTLSNSNHETINHCISLHSRVSL
jgi:hypothetical protein